MLISSGTINISDSRRDAEKYHSFLLAIGHATDKINALERKEHASIDEVLASLLPDLIEALGAIQAFVATYRQGKNNRAKGFDLTAVHPKIKLNESFLPWSKPLGQVLSDGKPCVLRPLEDATKKLIHGLEIFDATTAILVRMQIGDQSRIVGVCNRVNSDMGPFLAADRRALESIIELIAIGMRVGERRRLELENIQNISAAINAEPDPDELLPLIARKAAEVFSAPAASLMLWDHKKEFLIIEASYGLTAEYVKQQRVSRKKVDAVIVASENAHTFITPDLRKSPFGKLELIKAEHLCSVLRAQLLVSGELIGILNIYSKGALRTFTTDEREMAEIFANHAAIAIRNARLRQRELEGLLATSDALRATFDENDLLRLIASKVSSVFSAPVSLMFRDAGNNNFIARAGHGFSNDYVAQQLAMRNAAIVTTGERKRIKPFVITDLRLASYGFQDVCEKEQLYNALIAPLASSEAGIIGLLVVYGKTTPRDFTNAEMKMAGIIADQASIAIRTTQLHGQNKQRGEQLNALEQIALDITGELKINELLTSIIRRAVELVEASGGNVYLWDEKKNEIKPVAACGNPNLASIKVDKNRGIIHEVKRTKVPFAMPNYYRWSKRQTAFDKYKLTATLGVPILSDERLVGVIVVHDIEEGRSFDKADIELLQRFANHAAVAIENARLYETERKAEKNLRIILDTVSLMSTVNCSEAGLSTLAKRIVTAQPVTFCTILLLDENKQNLVMKVAYPNPRPLSTGVKWEPAMGERISLTQVSLMTHLVNLPEPQVFQQGQMFKGIDIIQYLRELVLLDEEIRSILVVPLKAGSEVFGLCILGETRSWDRSPFDGDKVELVGSMVTQGTVFVDRLRAHEATQNKLMMVERLRSIGEDLVVSPTGSMKSILRKVVEAACEVMGASSAIIYPWDRQMRTYDTDNIVYFGLRKKKSFSEKIRDEEGSMTSIVLRKEMVIVDDIQQGCDRSGEIKIWMGQSGFLKSEGVQAFVGVSLKGGENALGVLFVNFLEPHYFSSSELEAVTLFANQAVIAIENARLYEELNLKLEESSTLQKVGILFAETRDSKLVLDRVMQAALELIRADGGNILFYDKSKNEFLEDALMSAGVGLPLQAYKTRVRQRSGYSYEIINNIKPICIPDTALNPHVNPVTLEKGRRAALGVPLIGREGPVGVLWVHWKTSHQISEQDEGLLMALASQAAVFIENVKFFEQLKAENIRREEESLALQKVGISLTEPIELNEILYRVLQAALELIHGDEDDILFYDESSDEFDLEGLMCAGLAQPLKPYRTQVRQRTGLAYQIVKSRTPVFVPDTLADPRISPVAIEKGRRAMVGVPLLDHDGPLGVLWVNWKEPRQVSSRDASLLIALASQATVAIKGARRYEEIQRRSAHLQAVYEAGKAISAASVGLDKQQVLDRILEQAIERVIGISGPKASVGTIQLLDEETNELVVKSVFPRQYPQTSIAKFDHIPLDVKKSKEGRIGVTGRAAVTKMAQLVPDVSKDEDYISHNDDIKSELAVPILDEGRVIGVMDIESNLLDAFTSEDMELVEMLAIHVEVAVNTERWFQTQKERQTRERVAQMATGIIHDVNNLISNIPDVVDELRGELKGTRNDEKIEMYLHDLQSSATSTHRISSKLREFVIGGEFNPVTSDLGVLVGKVINDLTSSKPIHVKIEFSQHAPLPKVRVDPLWVEQLFSNLFHNAFEAIPSSREGYVLVNTWVDQKNIYITIKDNGIGIPKEHLENIFQPGFTTKESPTRLHGIGLYFCQQVAVAHRGEIQVQSTPGSETTFTVIFPVGVPIKEGIPVD